MTRWIRSAVLTLVAATAVTTAFAQTKPAELKLGMTTFLSGPAAVFGVPGKAAAEIMIEDINATGGVAGVKLKPIFIDEGIGGDKLLSEYRRVVQEEGVKVMLAAISSGSCNALAPVGEDLKVLNVMWDCGTEKILENKRYKYVVRTQANATSEMVATVLHLLRTKPNFKITSGLKACNRLISELISVEPNFGKSSATTCTSGFKVRKVLMKISHESRPQA